MERRASTAGALVAAARMRCRRPVRCVSRPFADRHHFIEPPLRRALRASAARAAGAATCAESCAGPGSPARPRSGAQLPRVAYVAPPAAGVPPVRTCIGRGDEWWSATGQWTREYNSTADGDGHLHRIDALLSQLALERLSTAHCRLLAQPPQQGLVQCSADDAARRAAPALHERAAAGAPVAADPYHGVVVIITIIITAVVATATAVIVDASSHHRHHRHWDLLSAPSSFDSSSADEERPAPPSSSCSPRPRPSFAITP